MATVHLALLWHQHQPCYLDMTTGTAALPWVRLHAIKDYFGMAAVLDEFPEVRATINLVPGMLDQLEGYCDGGVADPWTRHRDIPAEDLSSGEIEFILDKFFMASWDNMVRPVARYGELLEMRRFGKLDAPHAAGSFSAEDIRDLQVLSNLVWFHPLAVKSDQRLRDLAAKGRGFTEDDKRTLAAAELDIMSRIIPMHREMTERGQLELSTTPHYHPILPLLCNMERAKDAMPHVKLPAPKRDLAGDAREHVRMAMESHERRFGQPPRGMWPSEGSVSPEVVEIAAQAGIEWLATDEEILAESLGEPIRDGQGHPRHELYRPYKAESNGSSVAMVFRDHALSDAIGFRYSGWDGDRAASDFLGKLVAIAAAAKEDNVLVPVILDGENCWEHYPNQGLDFLRGVYGGLARGGNVRACRIGDYIDEHPPAKTLPRVFSGSWINHDFYIWIGTAEDVRGWEMLYRVREEFESFAGELDGETFARAKQALYAAEGSDWFWWFGEDHSSGMDEEFDRLFRLHLGNVYRLAGRDAPAFLDEPVLRVHETPAGAEPVAFLAIEMDGRPTHYFEWLAAGRATAASSGAMTRIERGRLDEVYYGFDLERMFLRIDMKDGAELSDGESLAIVITEPRSLRIDLPRSPRQEPLTIMEGDEVRDSVGMAITDTVTEALVPFADLGVDPGDTIRFKVVVTSGGDAVESIPEAGTIPLAVPSADFEKSLWRV